MIMIYSLTDGIPSIHHGVEGYLVSYIERYGSITSLSSWALENELTPSWVILCAKRAAAKGLIKIERLSSTCGRPYRASAHKL